MNSKARAKFSLGTRKANSKLFEFEAQIFKMNFSDSLHEFMHSSGGGLFFPSILIR